MITAKINGPTSAHSIIVGSSSTTISAQLAACLRDLARHFNTELHAYYCTVHVEGE
jgi:hypothetical protein